MIPHTLVLKPGLVIHSIYNGYWFWGRPSVVDLWHDLRTVTSEIRPDWDLATPASARRGTRAIFLRSMVEQAAGAEPKRPKRDEDVTRRLRQADRAQADRTQIDRR